MNRIKITIGIPVYNEEENICFLIEDILSQNPLNITLSKILVVSDGSTDKTVERITQIKDNRIRIIENHKRLGVAVRQNKIFEESETSDYLLLLNGDIRIKDKLFIQKVIECAVSNRADLVAVKLMPVAPVTFFERILKVSVLLKEKAFEKYKNGDNLFTCCGPSRVFSKNLFTKIKFKESPDEDAYSYLYCKVHNFRYHYFKDTCVYYRLPSNYRDHKRQSMRFFNQKNLLEHEFGEKFVKDNYTLPVSLFIWSVLTTFPSYPLETIAYFSILCVIKMESFLFRKEPKSTWEISTSTKNI